MQDKRERYLSLMGIDTYQLRQPEESPADVVMAEETQQDEIAEKVVPQENASETTDDVTTESVPEVSESKAKATEKSFRGIRYLSSAPQNGLLVVLPSVSKELEPAARQLMSKMLNAIQCQPSQTGFAESGKETEKDLISSEGVKAILFLDYQAGKRFIDLNGAQRVAGADYCDLDGINIVFSIHPQELLTIPELKATAWRDLKLIASFLQTT